MAKQAPPGGPTEPAAPHSVDAITAARAYGVDVDQLRASLERSPEERLRELDANMRFMEEFRKGARAS